MKRKREAKTLETRARRQLQLSNNAKKNQKVR